jgi:hypothetical protein
MKSSKDQYYEGLIKEISYICLSLNYLNSRYLKAELYVHFFLLDVSGVGFCTKEEIILSMCFSFEENIRTELQHV